MQILQTNQFKKAYKKLYKNQLDDANRAIEKIIADPSVGVQKKGDLSDVRVYKFGMQNQLTLIAYTYKEERIILTLMAIGTHENFYRDLK